MTTQGAVVVTGASTGIGRAVTLSLAANGYHVFAGVRKTADGESLKSDARGLLTPILLDVTDESAVRRAADEVAGVVGAEGIVGLVNNAGIGVTWPIEAIPLDTLRRQYDVNVFGQVAVIQAFLPLLRKAAGRMINIGTIGDRLTIPFGSPLTSSKWAFASITEALRIELRPWGIHVVLIEPASIHTEAVGKLEADAVRTLSQFSEIDRARYGDSYRSMVESAATREKTGDPPKVVADVVLRALTSRKPKTRYLVGKHARPLAFIARWAPDRIFDRIRVKIFGLPKEFGGMRTDDASLVANVKGN